MDTLSRFIVAIAIAGSVGAAAQASSAHDVPHNTDGAPTAVCGESWITHLSRPFNETSMGKTEALGPGTNVEENERVAASEVAPPVAETTLSGADLYRINCRGCHGAEGLGAPPEINSVINPVKATSAALVVQRMKSRGIDISLSSANELAKEAKAALLKRLHTGGENMPSFSYLTEAEIASITAYLSQLADMPGAAAEHTTVRESPERVGELVVKSTCHICHGATGPNPNEQQLYQGQIPPLETLPLRVDQAKFIRKATHGLPVLMGDPPMLYRGRMPVFYYLTSQEAADAYLYLTYYPPVRQAGSTSVAASLQESAPREGGAGEPAKANGGSQGPTGESRPDSGLTTNTLILIAGLFTFVVMLLAGGLAFTIREFARMSSMRPQSYVSDVMSRERHQEETHLVAT